MERQTGIAGVPARDAIAILVAWTSTSPVGISGLRAPSGRATTRPLTSTTHSIPTSPTAAIAWAGVQSGPKAT